MDRRFPRPIVRLRVDEFQRLAPSIDGGDDLIEVGSLNGGFGVIIVFSRKRFMVA